MKPYDCNVFSENDFAPSLTTEIEMEENSAVRLQNTDVNMTSNAIQSDDNRPLNDDTTVMVFAKDTDVKPHHTVAVKADVLTRDEKNVAVCSTHDSSAKSNVEQRQENNMFYRFFSFNQCKTIPNKKTKI